MNCKKIHNREATTGHVTAQAALSFTTNPAEASVNGNPRIQSIKARPLHTAGPEVQVETIFRSQRLQI